MYEKRGMQNEEKKMGKQYVGLMIITIIIFSEWIRCKWGRLGGPFETVELNSEHPENREQTEHKKKTSIDKSINVVIC